VKSQVKVVEYGGIVILVIEVIAVLTACVLSVMDHGKRNAQDDDDYARAPFIPYQSVAGVPLSNSNSPWSQHLSQKYNLGTSKFTYDPER